MNTPKLIMAFAILLFSSNVIFAGNSTILSNDSTSNVLNNDSISRTVLVNASKPDSKSVEDISIPMVENLNKDVTLTLAQKEKLKKNADEYATNLLKARAMSNKAESYPFMKSATENYKATIDSILTTEQKTQREQKQNERIDAIIKKVNFKN